MFRNLIYRTNIRLHVQHNGFRWLPLRGVSMVRRSVLLLIIIVIFSCVRGETKSDRKRLMDDLLKDYDKKRFPRKDPDSGPIETTAKIRVLHVALDENQETMDISGYVSLNWKDDYLTWDSTQYGGIDKTTLMTRWSVTVWTPRLTFLSLMRESKYYSGLYGNSNSVLPTSNLQVWLRNDGTVNIKWDFAAIATCNFDYSDFPRDVQTCPLVLYTRDLPLDKFKFVNYETEHMKYYKSIYPGAQSYNKTHIGKWLLLGSRAQLAYLSHKGRTTNLTGIKPFMAKPILELWLTFARNNAHFGLKTRLPAIVIGLLTILGLFLENHKASISFLASSPILYALMITDLLIELPPATGAAPNIVVYYGLALCGSAAALFGRLALIWFTSYYDKNQKTIISDDRLNYIRYIFTIVYAILFFISGVLFL